MFGDNCLSQNNFKQLQLQKLIEYMDSAFFTWLTSAEAGQTMVRLLFSAMVAILFLQSGIDKVVHWNEEKSFYRSHFEKTFLRYFIDFVMPIITIFEIMAGALSLVGGLVYLVNGSRELAVLGMLMACLSIIQLFFGQRIAKDYGGAATLIPYFLLVVFGLFLYTG